MILITIRRSGSRTFSRRLLQSKRVLAGSLTNNSLPTGKKRQSVAYNIEVIGEAANAIDREIQEKYPSIPWSDFIGMRNVLVHGYIKTHWLTVWTTATTEMDALEENVKDMRAAFPWPIP